MNILAVVTSPSIYHKYLAYIVGVLLHNSFLNGLSLYRKDSRTYLVRCFWERYRVLDTVEFGRYLDPAEEVVLMAPYRGVLVDI